MAPNPAEAAVSPPTHDGSDQRTHMGINHPLLARFLCPIGEITRFDEKRKVYFLVLLFALQTISERSSDCKRSRLG
jgi:hypothetical protein